MWRGERVTYSFLHLAILSICLICFVSSAGCGVLLSTATLSTPQSILKAVKSGPDRVTLEIFQVRVPADDKRLASELWQAADEQRLELDVRNQLVSNGFRAGVISGALPDGLSRAINLQSEMPAETTKRVITDESATPKVTRRLLQLKQREPATIQVSEVQPSLNVLLNSRQWLTRQELPASAGSLFIARRNQYQASGSKFSLPPSCSSASCAIVTRRSDQGIFVMTPSRERKVFDQMKMSVALAPGELLVISGIPDASGSLGSAFHAERRSDAVEQKLVLDSLGTGARQRNLWRMFLYRPEISGE